MISVSSPPEDRTHPVLDRRRALRSLLVLPLAAASLSLAGCAGMRPANSRSGYYGGGRGPGSTGGGNGSGGAGGR